MTISADHGKTSLNSTLCAVLEKIYALLPTVLQVSRHLGYVHAKLAQFGNHGKCNGSKTEDGVNTTLAQFENGNKILANFPKDLVSKKCSKEIP